MCDTLVSLPQIVTDLSLAKMYRKNIKEPAHCMNIRLTHDHCLKPLLENIDSIRKFTYTSSNVCHHHTDYSSHSTGCS